MLGQIQVSSQRRKLLQFTSPRTLRLFIGLVKNKIGIFPRDVNHSDPVLIFYIFNKESKVFAAHDRPTHLNQSFPITDHSLKHLDPTTYLRLGQPDQTVSSPIDRRQVTLNIQT